MADLHPDEVGFHNLLDRNPADWDTRSVYSDWLEENGRLPESEAQRWMVANKKHPYRNAKGTVWGWTPAEVRGGRSDVDTIPEPLANHLSFGIKSNRRVAEESLARALHRMKQSGLS